MNHVKCNRLVYTKEFESIEEKYEAMGMPIPKSAKVKKYNSIPLRFELYDISTYTPIDDEPHLTLVRIDGDDYIIDVTYLELDKLLEGNETVNEPGSTE